MEHTKRTDFGPSVQLSYHCLLSSIKPPPFPCVYTYPTSMAEGNSIATEQLSEGTSNGGITESVTAILVKDPVTRG